MGRVAPPPLWNHQDEAASFCMARAGALLDMWMGTGKSRVGIEVMRRSEAQRVIILAPLSVVNVWRKQFAMYAEPDVTALLLGETVEWRGAHDGTDFRKGRASVARKAKAADRLHSWCGSRPLAVVTNYESARSGKLADWLLDQLWDLVLFDEVHKLKSAFGATQRFAQKLSAVSRRRVGLTGTPMPHSPMDVFGEARVLDARVFGWSFVKFKRRYAVMGGFNGKEITGFRNQKELGRKLATITYSAGRDVLDLLPTTDTEIPVDLLPDTRRAYDDMDKTLRMQVGSGEVTAANALVRLLRLQQLTSGHAKLDEDITGESKIELVGKEKENALITLLDGLPKTEPVVVCCRFREDLDAVHRAAVATGRESCELSGRRKELEVWQNGGPPVLGVQIQSGGVGIDLTRARFAVLYSLGFSLGDYEQFRSRLDRPGQKDSVSFYHLVARRTVDVQVYAAFRGRQNVIDTVLAHMMEAQEAV